MNPVTGSKDTIILPVLIALAFDCFAFSLQAQTCQEGCLTNDNTVLGDDALLHNTGSFNTAIGSYALNRNATGSYNTATGYAALSSNTSGANNTATGFQALNTNNGTQNTANGVNALFANTTGSDNTATGFQALYTKASGVSNTATGVSALLFNTGNSNTATGEEALGNNTTGNSNIAVGFSAGISLTTGSNNIDIGNAGVAAEANTIRIGTTGTQTATFIAGIRHAALANGAAVAVGITADGQLGVRASSARFKESVTPMGKTSEAIFSLQPVTFRYKKDPVALRQFGLVAEEVAKVSPDLVVRDAEGKPFTVRYDEINAMLLNEFLKARRQIDAQQKQIEALTAGLQKVSAQVELSKTALQTIVNNQ